MRKTDRKGVQAKSGDTVNLFDDKGNFVMEDTIVLEEKELVLASSGFNLDLIDEFEITN